MFHVKRCMEQLYKVFIVLSFSGLNNSIFFSRFYFFMLTRLFVLAFSGRYSLNLFWCLAFGNLVSSL